MAKQAGRVRLIRLWVKTSHFKRVKNGFGSIGLRVESGWVDQYFSHDFFKIFYFFFLRKHVFVIWKVMQQIT